VDVVSTFVDVVVACDDLAVVVSDSVGDIATDVVVVAYEV